jgi:hypothetical protein
MWFDSPSWRRPPHSWGFEITLRRATLGRTSLDERSAHRRDLYLTKHNTRERQTSVSPARLEPAIPAIKRLQTHALDGAATVIAFFSNILMIFMVYHHLLTNLHAPPAARCWYIVICHSASWDLCEDTSRPSVFCRCFRSVLQFRPTACRVLRKVALDIPL